MHKQVLVTGGMGFIGSNFIRLLASTRPDWTVVDLDALTYAGNPANLEGLPDGFDHRFEHGDITDGAVLDRLFGAYTFDAVVNFAAESHVDRSLLGPEAFVHTNIVGTVRLLERVRAHPTTRFVQVSTDEVYGSLGSEGVFTETTPLDPSSPYSSSKASADLMVGAWAHSWGLDTVITRCSNNYGPYQFPEKLIPLMILQAREDKPLPVYGDGRNVRDWIHVEDHCIGVLAALERGRSGEVYHFGGASERTNLDVVQAIADRVAGHRDGITFVADRPGHDLRYAMAFDKAESELGWTPSRTFEDGLDDTIAWYLSHERWWQAVLSGRYRQDHARLYDGRLPTSPSGQAMGPEDT